MSNQLDFHEVTNGMTPEEIGGAISQVDAKNAVVWLGIDSLTAGSGGYSYDVVFEKMARGVSGWGGRFVQFTNAAIWSECDIFKTGANLIEDLPSSDYRWNNSLSGFGAYAESGGDFTFALYPRFNWAYADLYYYAQPTGVEFTIDRPRLQSSVNVDSSVGSGISSVRIYNNSKNGEDANGTSSETNAIRVRDASVDGDLVVFGVMFYSGDGGPVFINAAKGGRKTSDFIELDSSAQSEWFNALGVTHAIVNAGMNDRTESTPTEFEADLTELCSRFPSSTDIKIVRPNDPSDSLLDQYDTVYESVAAQYGELFNTVDVFGDYATVNGRGWMLDGVHPDIDFQYYIAQEMCKLIFGNARYVDTPAIIDYVADSTQ